VSALVLEETLGAVEAALAAGDADGAAAATQRALALCASLSAAGTRIEPSALPRLAALHARCLAAATATRDRLAGAIAVAGRSRRAVSAYGHDR
jgi:hypothetical protein